MTERSFRGLSARQLCFFAAFLLPTLKLIDAPALLAKAAAGDLLVPALVQHALQSVPLACLLMLKAKTGKGAFSLVKDRFGTVAYKAALLAYAVYFTIYAARPLLDLEKFSYAAFYDTASSTFVFTPFFFLCAYAASKSLSSLGRAADLSAPLFILSFVAIFALSVGAADFSALLPIFGEPVGATVQGVSSTVPLFFDAALFLPLIERLPYKKGDGVKIFSAYWVGAAFVLAFLALFFGVYSSIAEREHYAAAKIAQYFPALDLIGRIDLLFVYLLTVVLFFATCVPSICAIDCLFNAFPLKSRVPYSAALNLLLLAFTFFFNKRYNAVVYLLERLSPVFWVFSVLLPVLSLLFLLKNRKKQGGRALFNKKRRVFSRGEK